MNESRGRGRARAQRGLGTAGGPSRASASSRPEDRPRREAILDLSKYIDQKIKVKFAGGREVTGVLKGYDQLLNIVMDDIEEIIRDPQSGLPVRPPQSRPLGLAVLRGTSLIVLSPLDGSSEISNPFQEEA